MLLHNTSRLGGAGRQTLPERSDFIERSKTGITIQENAGWVRREGGGEVVGATGREGGEPATYL